MKEDYIFRKATEEDVDSIMELINKRIAWMDQVGIKQWNVTKYNERYPKQHYLDVLKDLYVVTENGKVVCAGTLYEEDDRWNSKDKAYYVHHLVTALHHQGLGYFFLENAKKKCIEDKKDYLRLDSADDNKKLEEFYTDFGFVPVGTCQDGLYHGILREIKL